MVVIKKKLIKLEEFLEKKIRKLRKNLIRNLKNMKIDQNQTKNLKLV